MKNKDFQDWKRHPVTQVVFSQLQSRIDEMKEILSVSAGRDSGLDREYSGAIKAYVDMLTISYEGDSDD